MASALLMLLVFPTASIYLIRSLISVVYSTAALLMYAPLASQSSLQRLLSMPIPKMGTIVFDLQFSTTYIWVHLRY